MASIHVAALRLLARRDHTTAELRKKLSEREFPSEEIDQELSALLADRTLDDRRVAEAHIRTASQVKHRGRLRIQRDLEARGVDRALVRELLQDRPADDDAAAIAHVLSRRPLPRRPTPADRRRLFQQLLRRGFTADAIAKALKAPREE